MKTNPPSPHSADRALFGISAVAALLLLLTSLAGILLTSRVYPTGDLVVALLPNDIANLAVGLPFLLATMFFARRGLAWARLCWPGALLYIVYNSLIAVFCLPPGFLAGLHLVQLLVCLACLWKIFRRWGMVSTPGARLERLNGVFLAGMGAFFLVRAAAILADPSGQTAWGSVEYAVSLADILLSLVWIASGVLLLFRRDIARRAAAAGLAQLGAWFIGLLLVMLIQPTLTGIPFSITDFLAIAVMAPVILIPGAIFIASLERNH